MAAVGARVSDLTQRRNVERLPEIGPERLHRRRELGVAPPGEANVHGRDRVAQDDGFDALSSDHGRSTMSERIATPSPLATSERTASTDDVRSVTEG